MRIPVESSDIPIVAARHANVIETWRHKLLFGPVAGGHGLFSGFKKVARAKHSPVPRWLLAAFPHGRVPGIDCECGFYSVTPNNLGTFGYNTYVTLTVELGGKVIEHARGYRAEYQTVLSANVRPCPCGAPASGLWVPKRDVDGLLLCRADYSCRHHRLDHFGLRGIVSMSQLEDRLRVPFTSEPEPGRRGNGRLR